MLGTYIDSMMGEASSPVSRSAVIAVSLFLLIPLSCHALTEDDGSLGLLLLGDVGASGSPVDFWLERDLIIDYFSIPMAQKSLPEKELIRYTSIYFPRNLEHMMDLYDMMVICEEEELFAWYTSPRHKDIMYRAVAREGMALFSSLPHEHYEFVEWANTRLSETLPHEYAAGYTKLLGTWKLDIETDKDLPPVFTPFVGLGMESFEGPHLGKLHRKTGATTWAWAVPHNSPFFISWEYGDRDARTSASANDLDEPWWGSTYRGSPSQNPWGGDLFLNIVYWSVGKEPITDLTVVRSVRDKYSNYLVQRGVTLSLVEFIDDFGANIAPLESKLEELSTGRNLARQLYYEQRYEEALEHINTLFDTMMEIEQEALKLKERAFFWIYLIEWLVVTAALMIVGFITWSLMVKRRLYREVKVTRAET